MNVLKLILVGIALFSHGCRKSENQPLNTQPSRAVRQSESAIEDEEYAVYSTVIRADPYLSKNRFVISKSTSHGRVQPVSSLSEVVQFLTGSEPVLPPSAIQDFEKRNKTSALFESRPEGMDNYSIKDSSAQANGPSLTFSRVGFSDDRRLAIVWFEVYSGLKSGSGEFIILTVNNGAWSIRNKIPVFVS